MFIMQNSNSFNLRTLVLGATLLLLVATAQADTVHTPKVGTAERAAIMDGLRQPLMRRVKQKVIFKPNILQVQDGWAFFEGVTLNASGKGLGQNYVWGETTALLRQQGRRWQVLKWGFATDTGLMEAAKKQYPQAPRAIFRLP